MKYFILIFFWPCLVQGLDINCSKQIEESRTEIHFDIPQMNTNEEARIGIEVANSYKSKHLVSVLYKTQNQYGLVVPLDLDVGDKKSRTWLVGTYENINGSHIVAHYGKPCPFILSKKISITMPVN